MRNKAWLATVLPLAMAAACMVDDIMDSSPFSDDDSDDPTDDQYGKADGSTPHYRDGCDAPAVHTGKYALGGDIVTPSGVVKNGWLVIDGEKIAEIRTSTQGKPTGMPAVDTGGDIYPGLIDGHGHVEYNHVDLADLGKRYGDRDQWPGASLYASLVKAPKNAMTAAGYKCEALKHGEARALAGGTVMIQGTPAQSCSSSLVRNIEQVNFCRARTRQNVMDISGFTRSISGKASWADSTKQAIAAKSLDAFIVHAGEGIDAHAEAEWGQLKSEGLALPQLVAIHATAFNAQDLKEMGQVGAKIIWSPSSNLILYGKTLDVPTAVDSGINVSLGTDWAPSGSANLLAELKIADHVNQVTFNKKLTDQNLVDMVTINPAKAFAMDKFIGSIEVGKYADLLVVAKHTGQTTQRDLINAKPQDVLLVTISGDALFGAAATFDALGKTGDYEMLDVCGTQRAIDVDTDSKLVQEGDMSFADIEKHVFEANPKATKVIDCTNNVATMAYKGTPLAQ
jgi:cytosine/adenosine deaminase-related metal-dependent hydrolase